MSESNYSQMLKFGQGLLEADSASKGASAAEKQIRLERIAADAQAARYLSEMECPNDLKDWGKTHGIPAFAEFTWQSGFVHGWRMSCARSGNAEALAAAHARGIAEGIERAAKIAGRIVAAFKQYGDEDEIGAAESVLDAIRSKAAKIGDSNDQS